MDINTMGELATTALKELAVATTTQKNNILLNIAENLNIYKKEIISQNEIDIINAKKNGLSNEKVERLLLSNERINLMISSIKILVQSEDPVGMILDGSTRPNGLQITKISVPIGVVGIIYESRPNVTIDSAALCIKSGNACILRGGSEAINTNIILADIISKSFVACGIDKNAVQLINDTSHNSVDQLIKLKALDVLIPRGGAGLINHVVQNATVPVIETGAGNCHIFVDSSADLNMALDIIINAKTSRPSVCNAAETVLIANNIADEFLPELISSLKEKNVECRLCNKSLEILSDISLKLASEEDYFKEYNDLIIAIKIVDDYKDAIEHINKYSTQHSECIITNDYKQADYFTKKIDSAVVYVNASTRFSDGGEFGFGAEIGISTQKLHARGPMGLKALTTYKYIVRGNGQVR